MKKNQFIISLIINFILIIPAYSSDHLVNCNSPLLSAIESGNIKTVRKAVKNSDLANIIENCDETPLYRAVDFDQYEIVKYLLSKGANPNKYTKWGRLPIELSPNVTMAKLLIKHGAKIDILDKEGWYPIAFTAGVHNIEVTKYLLSKGADINSKNKNSNWTPLMTALRGGTDDDGLVRYLINNGADIFSQTSNGFTTLMFAVVHGRLKSVEYLVKKGANVNAYLPSDGWTVLMIACEHGEDTFNSAYRFRIIQTLVQTGADIHAFAYDGVTTALSISQRGPYLYSSISKYLQKKGA